MVEKNSEFTINPLPTQEVFEKLKAHFTDKTSKLDDFCKSMFEIDVTNSFEFAVEDMENAGIPWHIINVTFQIINGSYLALTPKQLDLREQGRRTNITGVLKMSGCYSDELVKQFEEIMVTTATDVWDLQEKEWEKLGLSDQQIQKIKDNSVLSKLGSDFTV